MDRQYIDDHHVVARYLADQLADAEREAFEGYYLEHPELLQDLEAAARLKIGLERLRETGELQRLMKPAPWYRRMRTFALAASLLLAMFAAALWVVRAPSSQPTLLASAASLTDRLGTPLPVASTHSILRTRSIAADAQIELPPLARTIGLRVLPEAEAAAGRYRVSLFSIAADDSLQHIASLDGLAADADGFVPVYLNSTRLAAGTYQLGIAEDAAGAPDISTFLIEVSAAGSP